MRLARILFVSVIAAGCAPARSLDLVPCDLVVASSASGRWMAMESSRTTLSVAYSRTWLDHLIFDVEVVNQGDSTLVVDPAQFSLGALSSSGRLPQDMRRRFPAESPEAVRARLVREAAVGRGFGDALLGFTGIVLGTAVAVAIARGDAELYTEPAAGSGTPVDPLAVRRNDARRALEDLPQTLLLPTRVAPGRMVRGEVWFEARPLFRMLALDDDDDPGSEWSITATPRHAATEYAIELRAPEAAGAQEVEFILAR